MSRVRPAAVAGAFYPGDPRQLAADLDEMLGGVESFEPRFGFPKAVIVPHAGYIYSGPIAARAYDELGPARGVVSRVVLLGPVHRVPVRGLALPDADAFETPLGRVRIDARAAQQLSDLPQVVKSGPAHAMEHSLEVQLPFLQRMLGEFSLAPLAVGDATTDQVAEVIDRLWGGRETLFVVSTDLSHYHAYEDSRRIDGDTAARIEAFATDIGHEQACGATPLNGLLRVARARGLAMRRLGVCNSGDTAGGRGRVVGYGAFALDEAGAVDAAQAGRTLIAIARQAILRRLDPATAAPDTRQAAWLAQPGAVFVTLMLDGRLRGCIGSLEPHRALGEDVAANAEAAAFRDPRFPPLTAAEWPRCEVEVSLLSRAKPIAYADEADLLAQIRAGDDGIILEHAGKRATFLPQVWQGLPDKRAFLAELVKKAGLPADTRLARCKVSRYRVKKWTQDARQ
jgi:AmmeMemoRadiSam system protein B/AmmeMemoRadiSam system protein A